MEDTWKCWTYSSWILLKRCRYWDRVIYCSSRPKSLISKCQGAFFWFWVVSRPCLLYYMFHIWRGKAFILVTQRGSSPLVTLWHFTSLQPWSQHIKKTKLKFKELQQKAVSCLLWDILTAFRINLIFKEASLNRFYYLLYKHYKNSCTVSVILYDVVFLFQHWLWRGNHN